MDYRGGCSCRAEGAIIKGHSLIDHTARSDKHIRSYSRMPRRGSSRFTSTEEGKMVMTMVAETVEARTVVNDC